MARLRFIDWVLTKLPTLMQTPKSQTLVRGVVGDALDVSEYRSDQAVKQRLPDYAGDEALEAIGFERGLPRYLNELKGDYAARLKKAFSLWQYGGTPLGLLRALTGMGYPGVHLITARGQDHSLDGSGNLVTVVGPALVLNKPGWNHFLVVFRSPLIAAWQVVGLHVGGVVHSGTGSPFLISMACSNLNHDMDVVVTIGAGGPLGTATISVTMDGVSVGGATSAPTVSLNEYFSYGLADVGISMAPGTYVAGDVYRFHLFSGLNIPVSSSDEANRIRKAVRRWKWGNASFDGVLIQGAGNIWGYPSTLAWGASGQTWGSTWVYWPQNDGLTWGYPAAQRWGAGLYWGIPVPSSDE